MTVQNPLLNRLRDLIANGTYREGDRLPPERQLAERLKVSRTALRGALSVLEAEGRVWRRVGQGTFIGHRAPRSIGDLAQLAADMSPEAVIEARMAFEATAVRYAAQRAASSDIQRMHDYVARGERATEHASYDLWDLRFHACLVEAGQNPVLRASYEVITSIWQQVTWGMAAQRGHLAAERHRILTRQHRMILEAVEVRDSDRAENLVIEHWRTARAGLLQDPLVKKPRGLPPEAG